MGRFLRNPVSRSRSISEPSKSMENNLLLKKVRACVYGPRSSGGKQCRKKGKKPLPVRPGTFRSRRRKSLFWDLPKTSCFEKTAGVCGTLAQFFTGAGSPNATNPLRKRFNTYRIPSITGNIHTGRSGSRKTPRRRRRPAHKCGRRRRCPGWRAAPAPGSAGRRPLLLNL